jgi:hypothetical protein
MGDTTDNLNADLENAALQGQIDSLRSIVTSLLILLFIVSGTLNIYLWRQFQTTSKDLDGFRPYAMNVLNGYQKGDGPAVEGFVRSLVEFSQKNPDFSPILIKYGLKAGQFGSPATGLTGAAPMKATAPAPAKK